MTRLRRAIALSVVLPLLLAGCTTDRAADSAEGLTTNVDVDTPALRAAKQQAGVEPCEPGTGRAAEGGLPSVTLPCLGGGPAVELSTLRGPMVINLWAQWCGPCREELPYYQKLHESAGERLDVIGIDYQDPLPDRALDLIAATGVTYPLLADPAAELRAPFRIRGLPALVMVDADGKVVYEQFVVIRSYQQLRDLVEEHLDVTV
jgi:thiol-disulfide isomerase/thioredoxin